MWRLVVKLAAVWGSLFGLGFLSLYLGGKSKKTHISDDREIAWLQRLGSCDRFHEERDTRLAAYELYNRRAFEHIALLSFFFKERRPRTADELRRQPVPQSLLLEEHEDQLVLTGASSSGFARVDESLSSELERLIFEKRQGGGWFESGVEDVLAPLGGYRTVNNSELAAWVALPEAMERLREMLVCSEVGSDAASRTAEAIGTILLSSQRRSLRMAVYETGLTEALIARLSSSSSGGWPFRVAVASALLHATSTTEEEEALASEALKKRRDFEALKLGAHVESLMEMASGHHPRNYFRTTTKGLLLSL